MQATKSQIPLRYLVRSWFEAGSKLVADSFEAGSNEPVCDQLRTSFEPDSVVESGLHRKWYALHVQAAAENGHDSCIICSYRAHSLQLPERGTTQLLWSPYVIGRPYIFLPCSFFPSSFFLLPSSSFFSSPNLSGRRSDVYHTSTHGVALVWI